MLKWILILKKLRFQMTKMCVVNHDFATSVIIKITILITNLSLLTKAIKKETESWSQTMSKSDILPCLKVKGFDVYVFWKQFNRLQNK